jgi:hypothetical protein
MIEDLIEQLGKYAKLENSDDVERFDATLNQIAGLNDSRAIDLLLPFFKDKCQFPEVMFSIIHTIEMFDPETYARQIVLALPTLWERSPYWASVLHFRIFNHAPSREAYRTQLAIAETPVKAAARELLTTMRERQPKFMAACDEMSAVL